MTERIVGIVNVPGDPRAIVDGIKGLEDAGSEAGRAGKTEVQRRTRFSRCCFASFFRIRPRFRFER